MRPSKIKYYLNIAKSVSERATCLRRHFGAVIVLNDQIVSSGYCGAPRGVVDCLERNSCYRIENSIPSGSNYELCRSVHAEANAIINAARAGVSIYGGDMYIYGWDVEKEKVFSGLPCLMCQKMIVNTGLNYVYFTNPEDWYSDYTKLAVEYMVDNWNEDDVVRFNVESKFEEEDK